MNEYKSAAALPVINCRNRGWLYVLLLTGAALRVFGANHPLWLDEIWSFNLAHYLGSPLGVLVDPAALVDNNHPLNTLWLYGLPITAPYGLFHLPSLLAGIATLGMISRIAARRSSAAMLWATALAAVSLPLITFSDEARGYALAALFATMLFDAAECFCATPRWRWAAVFWLATIAGALAHLLIIHVYAGAAAMSLMILLRRWPRLLQLHVVPASFLLAFHLLFIRRLHFGGGAPRAALVQSLYDSLAGLLGWVGPGSVFFAAAMLAMLVALLIGLIRRRSPLAAFVIVGCFACPIALIGPQWAMSNFPVPLASRYFLTLLPIVIVLLAEPIARRRGLGAVALLIIAINLVMTLRFIAIGPSHANALLADLANAHHADAVLADHPLRTRSVLEFYAQRLRLPITVHDLSAQPQPGEAKIRWLVIHGRGPNVPRGIDLGNDRRFDYVQDYPAFGLSGYDFALYRRSD